MIAIGFSGHKSDSFFSWAIKFFTRSEWSHAFIVHDDEVLEASQFVRSIPMNAYRNDPSVYYKIYELTQAVNADVVFDQLKKKYLGKEYGYLQVLWFAYRGIREALGKKVDEIHNPFPDGLICSELVYACENGVGYQLVLAELPFDENGTHPQDLYNAVLNNPTLYKLIETK